MRDYDYGRCISACQEKARMGLDAQWCAVCQISRLRFTNAELRQALKAAQEPLEIAGTYAHAPECTLGVQLHGRDCEQAMVVVRSALAIPAPEDPPARTEPQVKFAEPGTGTRCADSGGNQLRQVSDHEVALKVMGRTYEHFMEDHEPKKWQPGRCAGYQSRGSLATHMFQCKGYGGMGVGGLFCHVHSKDERDNGHSERERLESTAAPPQEGEGTQP